MPELPNSRKVTITGTIAEIVDAPAEAVTRKGDGIPEGKEKFSTVVGEDTAMRVRVYAARHRMRPSAVVEMALQEWLDRNGG